MSYTSEDIRKASELFFHLLNNRILPRSHILANDYYDNNEVREIINNMAGEGGLRIFGTRQNLHLVVNGEESVFATSYSHMKGKYKLERKKHFHLANIIICIYLSEIDRDNYTSFRIEDATLSYYKLEEVISTTLESWMTRQKEESFSEDFAIAIDEIYNLWFVEMSHSKELRDQVGFVRSPKTRLGFIYEALKPLENEGLIINLYRENQIIPKEELYERLGELYHTSSRYEEIMELINHTNKEGENA